MLQHPQMSCTIVLDTFTSREGKTKEVNILLSAETMTYQHTNKLITII